MFAANLIKSSGISDNSFKSVTGMGNDGKCYTHFKKYSENGIVADENGNIFTEESEQFKVISALVPEESDMIVDKPKKKAFKKI